PVGAAKAGTVPVRTPAFLRRTEGSCCCSQRKSHREKGGACKRQVVVGALRFGKEDKRKPHTVIQGAMQAAASLGFLRWTALSRDWSRARFACVGHHGL